MTCGHNDSTINIVLVLLLIIIISTAQQLTDTKMPVLPLYLALDQFTVPYFNWHRICILTMKVKLAAVKMRVVSCKNVSG